MKHTPQRLKEKKQKKFPEDIETAIELLSSNQVDR